MSLFRKSKSEPAPEAHPIEEPTPESTPPEPQFGLAHEISPEYLRFLHERFRKDKGKFLRVGEVILLAAPFIPGTQGMEIQHREILEFAEAGNDSLKEKLVGAGAVAAASGSSMLHEAGILDAGQYDFKVDEQGNATAVGIFGRSGAYGQGNHEERRRTLELAQLQLGPEVKVIKDTVRFEDQPKNT